MSKPVFFISSTIYDFRDLRSAIKYYLEQRGAVVLASEYNDFSKELNAHSYEACLKCIEQADYFILLIGSRVGGWYDPEKRISITQAEYRHAYSLQNKGKIKIINFVRSELWTVREERRDLIRYLETCTLDDKHKREISNFQSKIAQDAEFLSNFIDEVGRVDETKAALKNGLVKPIGNWLHVFSGFSDLVDVIQTNFHSYNNFEEATTKRILRDELRDFLRSGLLKFKDGHVYSPKYIISKIERESPLTILNKERDFQEVGVKVWDLISSFGIGVIRVKFRPIVLHQVLNSSVFLEYDLDSGRYLELPVYKYLRLLSREIDQFNEANNNDIWNTLFQFPKKNRNPAEKFVRVETVRYASVLHLFDRWMNIIAISTALIKYTESGQLGKINLRHKSPVQGMQEEWDQETLSEGDIDDFLGSDD